MKKLISIVAVLVSAFTAIIAQEGCLPVNVTVKVVDEDNIPIEQADVEIIFTDVRPKKPGKGWGADAKYDKRKGVTNADGIFSASGSTNMNIPASASKSGFYEGSGGISFDQTGKPDKDIIVITLRKKKNPVPMYAKKVEWIKVPVLNQDVGYDLEVGDWVAPHGNGKISDFVFNMNCVINPNNENKVSYSLSFSNEKDGIKEYLFDKKEQSSFKWPYEAPDNNYLAQLDKKIEYAKTRLPLYSNVKNDNDINYIFRIRTKLDEKGNVIDAKYGKIIGEIDCSTKGIINFSYYFNPSGNRSLEFEKNLFIPEGVEKWKPQYRNFINFGP